MDDAKHIGETDTGQPPADWQRSAGLNVELHANQTVVDGLSNGYSVFAFTGGAIPSGQCELAAVNAYIACPFATNCISTEDVERYQFLVKSIMIPGEGISPRPRSLRGRKQIADAFSRAASEIQSLGGRFESALMIQDQSVPV
jgi:hypothetical protein